MNNPYLIHGLTVGPTIVRRIVEQVAVSRYDSRTDPERFTLREAIAHLADWEEIDASRIRQAIDQPGSTLIPMDEVARAEEQDYAHTHVMDQLALYEKRRKDLVAYLEALPAEAWGSRAFHPEKGELTVYDQANLVLGHDTYHIEHLTQFLAQS